jgi:hypothetical protein
MATSLTANELALIHDGKQRRSPILMSPAPIIAGGIRTYPRSTSRQEKG